MKKRINKRILVKILPLFTMVALIISLTCIDTSVIDSVARSIVSIDASVGQADIIVVYAGGSGRRIRHAAELAEAGFARNILILGTNGEKQFATSILSPWLKGRNSVNLLLPDIDLPDTRTSAQFAADYLAKAGATNAIMVSDDWHLRRVSLLMKNYSNSNSRMMYSHPRSQLREWWTKVDTTLLLAEECAKVAFCSMMLLV